MESKQVQLYLDREKTIEASPVTSADCVMLTDGNNLQNALDNDLTTPTVVHEETSFKVGQGDIDVSGSIVDGEVGRMVIKGQTYQNILPDPSLRNSMTNGKTMQKLNEGYDSVNTVDGVCKSAILSGQTLVNVIDEISFHSSANHYFYVDLKQYEINKDYLFMIFNAPQEITEVYFGNGSSTIVWRDYTSDFVRNGSTISLKVTCPSNYDGSKILPHIRYGGASLSLDVLKQIKVMLIPYQQGMENWDIPYFEGMQSVKMPVLSTIGKNLCKYRDNWTYGGLTFTNTENGVTVNGTASTYVDYYVTAKNSLINVETLAELNKLQVGTRLFLSNNLDKNSYISYALNGETKYANNNVTIQNGMEITGVFVRFQQGDICNNLNLTIQLEIGNEATSYEPYKSNILHTPEEVVLRSLPNGAKDTLNLNTGEYVQRIKEVTFDGSNDEGWVVASQTNSTTQCFDVSVAGASSNNDGYIATFCDKFPSYTASHLWSYEKEGVGNPSSRIRLRLNATRLSTVDVAGLRTYLQSNPITVQYELATPIVKTVDLSSSGNWEKVVLDGSEDESWGKTESTNSNTKSLWFMPDTEQLKGGAIFCDKLPTTTSGNSIGVRNSKSGGIYIHIDKMETLGVREWVAKNSPLTIWYQTAAHQDSTQVKQPIFFKDGHIQLSSGADNSLVPTLDYQAKTSNSYVMDLMKTNTRYTMKSSSASGNFTIDGTQYNFNTNGTFTTPSTMNNKLMIANGTVTDLMFIEGDVTSKMIPYFKGIKSAFEDEDKIEVLSTGKNLFDMNRRYDKLTNAQATVVQSLDKITVSSAESGTYVNANFILDKDLLKGKTVTGSCLYESDEKSIGTVQINYADSSGKWYYQQITRPRTFTFPNDFMGDVLLCVYANNTNTSQSNTVTVKNIQLEFGTKSTPYEPYKSNNTKIPLLSPLRSLPNGVCDELVIDRMKKKATLIQRVGSYTSNGSDSWGLNSVGVTTSLFTTPSNFPQNSTSRWCNNFLNTSSNLQYDDYEGLGCWGAKTNFNVRIKQWRVPTTGVTAIDTPMFKKWLFLNPITIYYEMATPVVTEIDLENFPLVYKDGHIFLNSEIAPVVEIDYNVNQSQQIQANNETLQRHELDILDLDNLIVSFVDCEYRLRLLKFDMELSMMALAE